MTKVKFEFANAASYPTFQPVELDVDGIPNVGDGVDVFDVEGTVVFVDRKYARNGMRNGGHTQTITITVRTE